jgi:hypothetical protein
MGRGEAEGEPLALPKGKVWLSSANPGHAPFLGSRSSSPSYRSFWWMHPVMCTLDQWIARFHLRRLGQGGRKSRRPAAAASLHPRASRGCERVEHTLPDRTSRGVADFGKGVGWRRCYGAFAPWRYHISTRSTSAPQRPTCLWLKLTPERDWWTIVERLRHAFVGISLPLDGLHTEGNFLSEALPTRFAWPS